MNNINQISKIAMAIRKLASAASCHFGNDCFLHALLACKALKEFEGMQSEIVIGFAGWRVGEGDCDVIFHAPIKGMPQQEGILYHAWLTTKDYIIDLSTYQLRVKAAKLDTLDGGLTQVDWCPDYLIAKHEEVSSLKDVTQLHAGLFYYEQNKDLEIKIKSVGKDIDEEDWANLVIIYNNPEVLVIGPNQMGDK